MAIEYVELPQQQAQQQTTSQQTLSPIITALEQSLQPDPTTRQQAEQLLSTLSRQPRFGLSLLELCSGGHIAAEPIPTAAAVYFKNFIRREWCTAGSGSEDESIIPADEKQLIRQNIASLMLTSTNERIQAQLSSAISSIGEADFPERWPELLPELAQKLVQAQDFRTANGILRTCHALFKTYRFAYSCDSLLREINYVMQELGEPLTNLFQQTARMSVENAENAEVLRSLYSTMLYVLKCYHSLISVDIPQHFADRLGDWMEVMRQLLLACPAALDKESDSEVPSVLDDVRSYICLVLSKLATQYDEDFSAYSLEFFRTVWDLLVKLGRSARYDRLACCAMHFLANALPHAIDDSTVGQVCQHVILPNVELRQADEELFEDNAEDFIRRDIEGSDIDTRRRGAADLIRGLLTTGKASEVTVCVGQFVVHLLKTYAESPQQNWRHKECAVYLTTSLASNQSAATHRRGLDSAKLNPLVNVQQFFDEHIRPELSSKRPIDELAIVKSACLKYVVTFRNQLPAETLIQIFPDVVAHVRAQNAVQHAYAAHCVDKLMTTRASTGTTAESGQQPAMPKSVALKLSAADLGASAHPLLKNLFLAAGRSDNEYVMKATMRTLSFYRALLLPHVDELLQQFAQKLALVAQAPARPNFNHYLFESLCICVTISTADERLIDARLLPTLEAILQRDVQEFLPYVFQLLALALDQRKSNTLPERYRLIYASLMNPACYERDANTPAIVRLLQSSWRLQPEALVAYAQQTLGVAQKLLMCRRTDHDAFALLTTLLDTMPLKTLQPLETTLFNVLLTRLHKMKTQKALTLFAPFFALFLHRRGAAYTRALLEERLQRGLFSMVWEKLVLLNVERTRGIERKTCAIAAAEMLCDETLLRAAISDDQQQQENGTSSSSPPSARLWRLTLSAVVALLADEQTFRVGGSGSGNMPAEELHFWELNDEFDPTKQSGTADISVHRYSALVNAARAPVDPIAEIAMPTTSATSPTDLRRFVVEQVKRAQQLSIGWSGGAGGGVERFERLVGGCDASVLGALKTLTDAFGGGKIA